MIFKETPLKGAYIIEPERFQDDRGFFARTWCQEEFASHGINPRLVQCNISFSRKRGTLRGMHYQAPPFSEDKLVRVTRGQIYDVIVDLRPDSDTFLRWFGTELSQENRLALLAPQGFAHGFVTLIDDVEVFYQMSEVYAPNYARGVRWNDPLVAINWHEPIIVISERDRSYSSIRPEDFLCFGKGALGKQGTGKFEPAQDSNARHSR